MSKFLDSLHGVSKYKDGKTNVRFNGVYLESCYDGRRIQSVRADFTNLDECREFQYLYSYYLEKQKYRYCGVGLNAPMSQDRVIEAIESYREMLSPADFFAMEEHLGITAEVRGRVEKVLSDREEKE